MPLRLKYAEWEGFLPYNVKFTVELERLRRKALEIIYKDKPLGIIVKEKPLEIIVKDNVDNACRKFIKVV